MKKKNIRGAAWVLRHGNLWQSAFQMRGADVEVINGLGGTRGTGIIFMR